jgi:hypothetical protein
MKIKVLMATTLIATFSLGSFNYSLAGDQGKSASLNTLTKAEKKEGWKLLFDGKTFKGWRGLGRDHVPNGTWIIEDGTIKKAKTQGMKTTPDGKPVEGGDLCTIEEFDNFELAFEWKINAAGNSGVKYNVSEEFSKQYGSPTSALGFEYQILDDGHPSYKGKLIPSQFTGSLYDLIPPQNVVLKPIGEFNSSRIIFNGNHIEHWLNGKKVMQAELGSQELIDAFKASKFNKMNGFLDKKKAHIVLTNHSDESWFRNIKIRDLNKY